MSAEYKNSSQLKVTSFNQVVNNLREICQDLNHTTETINGLLRDLIKCGYYNRVSIAFRCQVYETILFYEATGTDMEQLLLDLENGHQTPCQIEKLKNVADTAAKINTSLRFTWKTDSYPEEYFASHFLQLASVYKECATMLEGLGTVEEYADFLQESGK